MKQLLLTSCIYLFSLSLHAQDQSQDSKLQAGIQFSTTPYLSISNSDTIYGNAISLAPYIRFFDKGFGLKYAPYIISGGTAPGIYMHTLTAGYE
ncbi:MAG TPA: hypothetical protein VJ499_02425, partial [Flavisolibacter sp.]|nr:hypothetical protein [Flavisolibacter sp.]